MSWRPFRLSIEPPFEPILHPILDPIVRWVHRKSASRFAPRLADPYNVLGLTPSATADDIKRSFRALAKALHPDANRDDPNAAARFAELNLAYEILGNEARRKAFDRGEIDGQGNPVYRFTWGATGSESRVVSAAVACSAAALLLLLLAKLPPHHVPSGLRGDKEQAGPVVTPQISETVVATAPIPLQEPPTAAIAPVRAAVDANQIALLIQRSQDLISEGDIGAARVLLRRAAEANSARAAITLGATYDPVVLETLSAQGVAADISQARFWYERASELGSKEAQVRLNLLPRMIDAEQMALLIRRSQDLISEGDVAAARVLLRRAAEADSARAAITLGATYDPVVLATLRVKGVTADVSQARLWYSRASELGSQEAQVRLSLLSQH
jgi:TPR repeat protein